MYPEKRLGSICCDVWATPGKLYLGKHTRNVLACEETIHQVISTTDPEEPRSGSSPLQIFTRTMTGSKSHLGSSSHFKEPFLSHVQGQVRDLEEAQKHNHREEVTSPKFFKRKPIVRISSGWAPTTSEYDTTVHLRGSKNKKLLLKRFRSLHAQKRHSRKQNKCDIRTEYLLDLATTRCQETGKEKKRVSRR